MLETVEKEEAAGTSSRSCSGKRSFDFSPWTSLPPLSPVKLQNGDEVASGPGPIERAVALLLLTLATPAVALIALAIKIESPRGPVFYRQERVGLDRRRRQNGGNGDGGGNGPGDGHVTGQDERRRASGQGRPFMIWKFRTMIPDAEAVTGPVWATQGDPRVTRVGHVLRKLRADEAPQLINIVQGHMRFIGPRPERPQFVEKLCSVVPEYARRHRVPPGITGLAQVQRSYDSDLNDVRTKVKYDLYYVENRCVSLNLKILMKTVDVVAHGYGAH